MVSGVCTMRIFSVRRSTPRCWATRACGHQVLLFSATGAAEFRIASPPFLLLELSLRKDLIAGVEGDLEPGCCWTPACGPLVLLESA